MLLQGHIITEKEGILKEYYRIDRVPESSLPLTTTFYVVRAVKVGVRGREEIM